jgi:hypothetical protein
VTRVLVPRVQPSHEALPHRRPSLTVLPRKMRAAASAAPKPLSMLTTVTPEAQLVNIDANAVNP